MSDKSGGLPVLIAGRLPDASSATTSDELPYILDPAPDRLLNRFLAPTYNYGTVTSNSSTGQGW